MYARDEKGMLTGRAAERLLGMVSVTALLLSPAPPAHAAERVPRKGAFAFQYAPRLTDEQLAWYSRFAVLVTHDPLPGEQVRVLHEAGTTLLFYEWSVAFYESRASAWQRTLLLGAKGKLLHARPLHGGVGSTAADAWYFDPAADDFAAARAEDLVQRLDASGYDGVFLDTTRFESVHPDARREYARRHPDLSYDAAFARFLAALHTRLGTRPLFTNQGYRSAEHYLPHVQWDLTESLITRPHDGRARLRPWNDPQDPWNSILHVLRTMIEPVARHYTNVHFAHLNYIDAPAPEAIRVAVAAAQLFGGEAYVAAKTLADERDGIYFRDPGIPTAPRVDWPEDAGSHRFFDRGLIAIGASQTAMSIDTNGRTFRNHFTGEIVCGGVVIIPPSPAGPTAWFFDDGDASECGKHERADPLP
jgi:hypothetical protein